MKFIKNDKIQINTFGADWLGIAKGKKGTVVGFSRTPLCVRVIFDGQKTPQIIHESLISKIRS